MPPRRAQHQSKPSMGLDGDNDQLSPLSHGALSPARTNIQMTVDEDSEHGHEQALPYDDDGSAPVDEHHVDLSASSDPSLSGEFDTKPAGCLTRVWRSILAFPALSTIFPITLVVSIFFTFILVVAAPDAFEYLANPASAKSFMPSTAGFVISLLYCIFLIILAMLATRQLLYQLAGGEIRGMQIVGMFLSNLILYGDLYQLCTFFDATCFTFAQGSGVDATTNVVSVWVGFLYYSVSTMTATGYGDITPRSWFPKAVACTQMLSALLYHIGVFSIGLKHFQSAAERVQAGTDPLVSSPSSVAALAKQKMRELRTKYPRLDRIRKVFIRYVFGFSLLTQLVLLVVLEILDPDMFNSADQTANAGIILIFFVAQCFQVLLVALMTLALVRQVSRGVVQPAFLVQSWLANVSLFCGVYSLIYLLVPGYDAFKLWDAPASASGSASSSHQVVDVVAQFFWFSLVTMTTTGYGDVYPVHIAARLAVCAQMIITMCYSIVILGQALVATMRFLNQIRIEHGAEASLARGGGNAAGASRATKRTVATIPEEEDSEVEISAVSLSGFEGAAPYGEEGASDADYTASEADYTASEAEEEEVAAPRAAPAPAAGGKKVAAAAAASAAAAQAQAAVAQAARAGVASAKAGAEKVRKAAPGALAASQAAASDAASRASAAVEARAPGLQKQVARDARQAAQTARVVGAVAGAVATEAAEQAYAAAPPQVHQAVRAAQPKLAAAKQAASAAASKTKAAAQQAAQHARDKSRGMFDPSSADVSEDDQVGM